MPSNNLYAIDTRNKPTLGTLELGLQKLRWHTPWTNSTRTLSRAISPVAKRAGAVTSAASQALARGVIPPPLCLPSSMRADINLNQSMRAWAQPHLSIHSEAQWQALNGCVPKGTKASPTIPGNWPWSSCWAALA